MPATAFYSALWRHRLLIIVLTALAGIAAYLVASSRPEVYEASSMVRVQQRAGSPGDTFGSVGSLEVGQRLAQTYAKIVTTRSIRQRVVTSLATSPRDAVPLTEIHLTAEPIGDVDLLRITAESGNPRTAAVVANAAASSLKQFITETGTLRDQIVVVDRAVPPTEPSWPRPMLAVALAVMVALLLNIPLALLLEYFSDRLPELDEFEETFGRPVLATVPGLAFRNRNVMQKPTPPVSSQRGARGAPGDNWPPRRSVRAPSETGGSLGN
jgi:capsular polysaccharide biosynthesis protein